MSVDAERTWDVVLEVWLTEIVAYRGSATEPRLRRTRKVRLDMSGIRPLKLQYSTYNQQHPHCSTDVYNPRKKRPKSRYSKNFCHSKAWVLARCKPRSKLPRVHYITATSIERCLACIPCIVAMAMFYTSSCNEHCKSWRARVRSTNGGECEGLVTLNSSSSPLQTVLFAPQSTSRGTAGLSVLADIQDALEWLTMSRLGAPHRSSAGAILKMRTVHEHAGTLQVKEPH
jgi:hypothetical protein